MTEPVRARFPVVRRSIGFGLVTWPACYVEQHQTERFGWRWTCKICGKSDHHIATEDEAHAALEDHSCKTRDEGNVGISLGLANRPWTRAVDYKGWF